MAPVTLVGIECVKTDRFSMQKSLKERSLVNGSEKRVLKELRLSQM